ncbi:MAG: serine/threonine protein kinase, partial [Planctomycetes bacterium]|nr:serine/threonine protein kinase [Planctomycetota bacterium]
MTQPRTTGSDLAIIGPAAPTVSGPTGSYRIIRLLGRGSMASVYLAEQLSMARPVALKILSPALAGDPSFLERFIREAKASGRLNHPHIVTAIDFGENDSCFFLAREYVDGVTLAAALKRDGALEEKRVIELAKGIISALAHAAGHNVIHLDIKPANIMIRKDGQVKLTDFG